MTLENWIRRLVGEAGATTQVAFTEGGKRFLCSMPDDNLWGAVKDILLLSEYERAGVQLSVPRGLVVDAGAHVGLFALRVSPHARRVIALEADATNWVRLSSNLARNHVGNVEAKHMALWSSTGEIGFTEGPQTGGGSVAAEGEHRVRATSLQTLVDEYGDIGLLKLDVEGAEWEIFEHAPWSTMRRIDAIVAELHPSRGPEQADALAERLRSADFEVTVLGPPLLSWRDSLRRILRNWTRTRDLLRLKVVVLAVYLIAPIVAKLAPLSGGPATDDGLLFLYARRANVSPAGASGRVHSGRDH
jgi:FkbM family methyltransferase